MAIKAPKNPFHPGEILLEEFIIPNEWTHTYVAEQLGWTKAKLSELINKKRGITAETALDLSELLGTTAKLWMSFQATYDLDKAKKKRTA